MTVLALAVIVKSLLAAKSSIEFTVGLYFVKVNEDVSVPE
jgi:hypothetical protein